MDRPFAAGERVKLTEHGVKAQYGYNASKARVDWAARRGVVQRYTYTGDAIVIWNGRHTTEAVSPKLLERA